MDKTFNILISGNFSQNEIKIKWNPSLRLLPIPLMERIEAYWNKAVEQTSKSQYIFNGELCRLNGWKIEQNRLNLYLGRTNYKELLYSNNFIQEVHEQFGTEFLANALGVSAILVSLDEESILIERSDTVGEYPGRIDVLGGHIHPLEHAVARVPDPFLAIKAEIHEEVNLQLTEQEPINCLGLIENKATKKPELIFFVKSQRTSQEIIGSGFNKNSSEVARVFAIPDHSDSLNSYLTDKKEQLSPSAIGALWLYMTLVQEQDMSTLRT